MKASILAWLMTLPWTAADKATETVEVRHERMSTIAEVVSEVARGDRGRAAFILVDFKNETDFDAAIQRCECKRYQCDPRKSHGEIEFLAHGLSQVHQRPSWDIATWWEFCGTTAHAVRRNAWLVSTFYRADNMECGYARLAGIAVPCNARLAVSRAAQARALMVRL